MPGADDDASGTAQVLGIARAIKRAGIKGFEEKVTLALFAGEEQGLLGSQAFASTFFFCFFSFDTSLLTGGVFCGFLFFFFAITHRGALQPESHHPSPSPG